MHYHSIPSKATIKNEIHVKFLEPLSSQHVPFEISITWIAIISLLAKDYSHIYIRFLAKLEFS